MSGSVSLTISFAKDVGLNLPPFEEAVRALKKEYDKVDATYGSKRKLVQMASTVKLDTED
jgi:hypothetical protein